jgi:hypothetical protein
MNTTEAQVTKLVGEEFPNTFMERGKQIALTTLDKNKKMAEAEALKYADVCSEVAGDKGPENRVELRKAAKDLAGHLDQIAATQIKINEVHKDSLPGGLPEPGQETSSAYDAKRMDELQAEIKSNQDEFDKKRASYEGKFPIFTNKGLDIPKLAQSSDAELQNIIGGKVSEVLESIKATEDNITSGKLRIWQLKDVVQMTKQSMSIEKNETLLGVVDNKVAEDKQEKADDEAVEKALKSFAMTTAIIAGLATANPAIPMAVGLVLGAVEVIEIGAKNQRLGDASNVSIDQAAAKMSAEEPKWTWMIAALAGMVVDAVVLVKVFKQLRLAASTLEAFSKAARRALPAAEAEELIGIARREMKSGLDVTEQLKAVGASFDKVEKVKLGLLIAKYGEKGYAEAFLKMADKKVFKMTEEGIRAACTSEAQANALIRKYIGPPPQVVAGGFYEPAVGTGGAVFIKPGNLAGTSGAVIHEITHEMARMIEPSWMSKLTFYSEFQAHIAQQRYLERVVADYGIEVVPEAHRWMVNATEEEMALQIERRYNCVRDAEEGIVTATQEDIVSRLVAARLRGIDAQKELMDKLVTKVGGQ